mmetsp:Transcript_83873/g.241165  ORF Transcript_83873/g.241165 Transcript_83873/m.241165 type:complete len:271 (+) Transcript_83873:530-1342(+)
MLCADPGAQTWQFGSQLAHQSSALVQLLLPLLRVALVPVAQLRPTSRGLIHLLAELGGLGFEFLSLHAILVGNEFRVVQVGLSVFQSLQSLVQLLAPSVAGLRVRRLEGLSEPPLRLPVLGRGFSLRLQPARPKLTVQTDHLLPLPPQLQTQPHDVLVEREGFVPLGGEPLPASRPGLVLNSAVALLKTGPGAFVIESALLSSEGLRLAPQVLCLPLLHLQLALQLSDIVLQASNLGALQPELPIQGVACQVSRRLQSALPEGWVGAEQL